MYYNTTNEVNPQLKSNVKKALNQDDQIFKIAQKLGLFSASQIFRHYPTPIPITSVRRSLNTLMNDNKIEKTDSKRIGLYNREEYIYKIK